MAVETAPDEVTPIKGRRGGLWNRLRRGRDEKTPPASPASTSSEEPVSRDDPEAYKWPSKAGRYQQNVRPSRLPTRKLVTLDKPPEAKDAAFNGPPRYDWIDIETAAAIKVQAAYRRNRVMNALAKQGITTAAIRNRNRRLRAQQEAAIPSMLGCCGMTLAFGMEESDPRDVKKITYAEKKQAKFDREEEARRQYRMKHSVHRSKPKMAEAFEVVE